MKTNSIKILAILLVTLLSGCAAHNGYMQSSASLDESNFSYIKKDAQGTAKATYILGIGGLSKKALVNTAKQRLLETNSLKDSQALANITVNWRMTFFLIGFSNRCTVTADIVEFK
jgi:hypothetical protein